MASSSAGSQLSVPKNPAAAVYLLPKIGEKIERKRPHKDLKDKLMKEYGQNWDKMNIEGQVLSIDKGKTWRIKWLLGKEECTCDHGKVFFKVAKPKTAVSSTKNPGPEQEEEPEPQEREGGRAGREEERGDDASDAEEGVCDAGNELHCILNGQTQKWVSAPEGRPVCPRSAKGGLDYPGKVIWPDGLAQKEVKSVLDCMEISLPLDWMLAEEGALGCTNMSLPQTIPNLTAHEFVQCLGVLCAKCLVDGATKDLWKQGETFLIPPFNLGGRFGLARDRYLMWVRYLKFAPADAAKTKAFAPADAAKTAACPAVQQAEAGAQDGGPPGEASADVGAAAAQFKPPPAEAGAQDGGPPGEAIADVGAAAAQFKPPPSLAGMGRIPNGKTDMIDLLDDPHGKRPRKVKQSGHQMMDSNDDNSGEDNLSLAEESKDEDDESTDIPLRHFLKEVYCLDLPETGLHDVPDKVFDFVMSLGADSLTSSQNEELANWAQSRAQVIAPEGGRSNVKVHDRARNKTPGFPAGRDKHSKIRKSCGGGQQDSKGKQGGHGQQAEGAGLLMPGPTSRNTVHKINQKDKQRIVNEFVLSHIPKTATFTKDYDLKFILQQPVCIKVMKDPPKLVVMSKGKDQEVTVSALAKAKSIIGPNISMLDFTTIQACGAGSMVRNPAFDYFIYGCLEAGVGLPFGNEYWAYFVKSAYNFPCFRAFASKIMIEGGSLVPKKGYHLELDSLSSPSMLIISVLLMSMNSGNAAWFKGESSFVVGKSDSGEEEEEDESESGSDDEKERSSGKKKKKSEAGSDEEEPDRSPPAKKVKKSSQKGKEMAKKVDKNKSKKAGKSKKSVEEQEESD